MRGGSITLALAIQLVLARLLGAEAFGVAVFALAWMKSLSVAASLGMERVTIREVSACVVAKDWPRLRAFAAWVATRQLGAALVVALSAAAALWFLAPDPSWRPALVLAMALLPVLAIARAANSLLSGLQQPVLGQLPEQLVQPALILLLVGAAALVKPLSADDVLALHLVAAGLSTALAVAILWRMLPRQVRLARPEPEHLRWNASLPPMLAIAGAVSMSAALPVILTGWLVGPAAAGVMAVARNLADLVLIPGLACASVLAARLGRLSAEGDLERLQATLTVFTRRISLAAGAILFGLVIAGERLLAMFGPEFATALPLIWILGAANLVSAVAGANALVLVMSGKERLVAVVSAGGLALSAGLGLALIPALGVAGAAIGAATGLIAWNLALAAMTPSRTGLRPSIFAPRAQAPGAGG